MFDQHAQSVVPSSRNSPRRLRHWQGPAFVPVFAVLLFASGLALESRSLSCQHLATLGIRHTLQTRHATFGVGHGITDFSQGLTLDGRLASGEGTRSRASKGVLKNLR